MPEGHAPDGKAAPDQAPGWAFPGPDSLHAGSPGLLAQGWPDVANGSAKERSPGRTGAGPSLAQSGPFRRRSEDFWFRPEPFRQGWFVTADGEGRQRTIAWTHLRQLSPRPDGTGWRLQAQIIGKAAGEAGGLAQPLPVIRMARVSLVHGWRLGETHLALFAGLSRSGFEQHAGPLAGLQWRQGLLAGGQLWRGLAAGAAWQPAWLQLHGEIDTALAGASLGIRIGFRRSTEGPSLAPEMQWWRGSAVRHGGTTLRLPDRQLRLGLGLRALPFGEARIGFAAGSAWQPNRPARPYATVSLDLVQ